MLLVPSPVSGLRLGGLKSRGSLAVLSARHRLCSECPSSFSSADNLCRKLEDLQQFQKSEPDSEEEVDILTLSEPLKTNIKKEQEEKQEEVKFYLPPTPGSEFITDVAQKVGAKICEGVTEQLNSGVLLGSRLPHQSPGVRK